MKNVLNKYWKFISKYSFPILILISIIVGLITWDFAVGFYVFFIGGCFAMLFIVIRELYWYFSKTGYYENKNSKK